MMELRSYANATDEVKDAQSNGDGEESRYWQGKKGQSYLAMSERAKSIASTFAVLYSRDR